MNKYIITLAPGRAPTQALVDEVIGGMIPGNVQSLYTHFYQPDGVVDCPTPLTISWWRAIEAVDSLLVLIDWRAQTAAQAARKAYLAQSIAAFLDTSANVLSDNLHRLGYTEADHAQVVEVSRFLACINAHNIPITHVYSGRVGEHFGSLAGMSLTPEAHNWLVKSIRFPLL